jgi:hypothetical protein
MIRIISRFIVIIPEIDPRYILPPKASRSKKPIIDLDNLGSKPKSNVITKESRNLIHTIELWLKDLTEAKRKRERNDKESAEKRRKTTGSNGVSKSLCYCFI